MWTVAKLKKSITATDTYFALADNAGFDQIMEGDLIVMDRVRSPEYMLVTGFDENNKLVQVERGYRMSTASDWKKGTKMRIFRIMNAPAQTEVVLDDIKLPDNTVEEDTLIGAYLVYQWSAPDTCLPGCYWLEFKLIKMLDLVLFLPGGFWDGEVTQNDNGIFYTGTSITNSSVAVSYDSVHDRYLIPAIHWTGDKHLYSGNYYTGIEHDDGSVYLTRTDIASDPTTPYNESIEGVEGDPVYPPYNSVQYLAVSIVPSFTSVDPDSATTFYDCSLGDGVEWIRRFPVDGEGYLIRITDSPTIEGL